MKKLVLITLLILQCQTQATFASKDELMKVWGKPGNGTQIAEKIQLLRRIDVFQKPRLDLPIISSQDQMIIKDLSIQYILPYFNYKDMAKLKLVCKASYLLMHQWQKHLLRFQVSVISRGLENMTNHEYEIFENYRIPAIAILTGNVSENMDKLYSLYYMENEKGLTIGALLEPTQMTFYDVLQVDILDKLTCNQRSLAYLNLDINKSKRAKNHLFTVVGFLLYIDYIFLNNNTVSGGHSFFISILIATQCVSFYRMIRESYRRYD